MSEQTNTDTVIVPEGDIVASAVVVLKERLREAAQQSPRGLTIDMAGVTQVDSVGLGLLIATHNTLAKTEGRLVLANTSEDIRKLLRAMRLDKHFQVNP